MATSEAHKRAQAKYRESHRAEMKARRLAKIAAWKAAGMCAGCGLTPPESGRVRCAGCNAEDRARSARDFEARRARQLAKYRAKVASGTCVECDAPAVGGTRCDEHRMRQNARGLEFSRRNPESKRATWIRARYGLSIAEWDALLASQGGACAICKGTDTRSQRNWHVDHDHSTGAVRGLLCGPCNSMLGMARDNQETLLEAVKYLQKHASNRPGAVNAA